MIINSDIFFNIIFTEADLHFVDNFNGLFCQLMNYFQFTEGLPILCFLPLCVCLRTFIISKGGVNRDFKRKQQPYHLVNYQRKSR